MSGKRLFALAVGALVLAALFTTSITRTLVIKGQPATLAPAERIPGVPVETRCPPPGLAARDALDIVESEVAGIVPKMELLDIVAREMEWHDQEKVLGTRMSLPGFSSETKLWLVAIQVLGNIEESTFAGSNFDALDWYPSPAPPTATPDTTHMTEAYYVIDKVSGTVIMAGYLQWGTDHSFDKILDLPGEPTPSPPSP